MATAKRHPTQEKLQSLFDYQDGELYWKASRSGIKDEFSRLGSVNQTGYVHGGIDRVVYKLHRLIYIYFHGDIPDGMEIDHRNGNRVDNKIENLRCLSHQMNMFNQTKAKGWTKHRNKFQSEIKLPTGERKFLGTFNTKEEASTAYFNEKQRVWLAYMEELENGKPKCL